MVMWSGKAALDYDILRVFCCLAYYHVSDGKLEPRARKTVFLGSKEERKATSYWTLKTGI